MLTILEWQEGIGAPTLSYGACGRIIQFFTQKKFFGKRWASLQSRAKPTLAKW
jgi:hypothetical protein